MNKIFTSQLCFLLIPVCLFSCAQKSSDQKGKSYIDLIDKTHKTYLFIESNISIKYDSNMFKIRRYSNTTYRTEAYDFDYQDGENNITFMIQANHPSEEEMNTNGLEEAMVSGLKEIKGTVNDTFSILDADEKVQHINDFSCVGFVGFDKYTKQYATRIMAFHHSKNDMTEVHYIAKRTYANFVDDYEILKDFLAGFKTYSAEEIQKEKDVIKSAYTIEVHPTKIIPDQFNHRSKTFVGEVTIKEPLKHKLSEVRLQTNSGEEIFTPDENGKIFIMVNDEEHGEITKTGEIIFITSFGKKIGLIFIFTYVNKGLL